MHRLNIVEKNLVYRKSGNPIIPSCISMHFKTTSFYKDLV